MPVRPGVQTLMKRQSSSVPGWPGAGGSPALRPPVVSPGGTPTWIAGAPSWVASAGSLQGAGFRGGWKRSAPSGGAA